MYAHRRRDVRGIGQALLVVFDDVHLKEWEC